MKQRAIHPAIFPAAFAALLLVPDAAALRAGSDWPQFLGPGGAAVGDETGLPVDWSDPDSLAWKVELPGRGVSSPIVVGGRVFLTANSGYRKDRLHVLCFDAASGAKLWERQFWSTGRTMCHPKTCMAAPTPASDGESIFAFFATNDLFCLDLDGNLIWLRGLAHDYPNASNATGMASSPIVAGGIVVVQVENQSHSFAAGIDAGTGVNIWKIPRGSNPSWSTPVLLSYGDGDAAAVVLESWDLVSGHDLRTGEQIWVHEEKCYCIPSCALHEGLVLVPSGGLTALRPGARGEAPEVAWRSTRLRPATSSPVVHRGSVYALSGAGVLACGDASSGEARWQLRLKGPYSSTPVIAGEHIFCINEEGGVHVVRLGAEQGEVAGQAELGETILASPAIAQGGIFIRSDRHLWKFGKKK